MNTPLQNEAPQSETFSFSIENGFLGRQLANRQSTSGPRKIEARTAEKYTSNEEIIYFPTVLEYKKKNFDKRTAMF